MLSTPLCRTLVSALILSAPLASASTVLFTFESITTANGWLTPESDPSGTGFTATYGANAPAGTFVRLPAPPPEFLDSYLAVFPNSRFTTTAIGEINPYDSQDYTLVIESSLAFTAITFDWMHYSVPEGGYLEISDGLGKVQRYYDDGSMSFDDGFSLNGNVAGTAYFETSAPVTSIMITGWDTNDSPPGSPSVQAIGLDNVSFTLVPEPSAALLSAIGTISLLRRKRRVS